MFTLEHSGVLAETEKVPVPVLVILVTERLEHLFVNVTGVSVVEHPTASVTVRETVAVVRQVSDVA